MADDVAQWLERLGLGRHAQAFADSEIDFDVLPRLTEEDLSQLGLSIGARRRLQGAIEALYADEPSTRPDAPPAEEAKPQPAEAERRQLTVMFVDLVGSTALAERLDPEDLREVIRAYQETCAEAVGRFEGHIAKYIGDGLLVYFGYPQAHEDDARRAVSAGLGIVEDFAVLNRRLDDGGVELGVRVGVHTGLVVVGEMGGGSTRETDAIVGETPNVAARLEGLAEPNTVVIGAATQRLVEGLFEFDDLGLQILKGVSKPVRVFRVQGESAAASRFEAAAEQGLTPLVGREEEIGLLIKRWEQARDGEGQVVLLSAEAGVGKSRIVRGFRERLEAEPHSRILIYGSAYYQNSAFYPVIDQLERALRFAREDGPEEKLAKLETLLVDLGLPVIEHLPLLADLISLSTGDSFPLPEMAPQARKQMTEAAVAAVYQAMAERQPILMVVEDAHWIDPSTLELLSLLIERLRAARFLLLVTFRPEFDPPWSGHGHVTAHALNRLGRKDARAMVTKVTDGKALPDEVLDQIVAKADGVPLYIEELTKAVIESEVVREEDGEFVLTGPLPPLGVPASLQDSLMARLDRLGAAKEVAQLGAVLGRAFDYNLLTAVAPLEAGALDDALARLVEAGLAFRRDAPREVMFEFKHALVRDAAYESLLKSTRQQVHGRIAEALENHFTHVVETRPELVAQHFTEAGIAERAVTYWLMAGQRAKERSANLEAVSHLTKGLELLATLPDTEKSAKKELVFQINLGPALVSSKGASTPEVEQAYMRARELGNQVGNDSQRFAAQWGLWFFNLARARFQTAQNVVGDLIATAERQSDTELVLEAHHAAWATDFILGEFNSCRGHAEQGRRLYDRHKHRSHKFLYGGHDPSVCGLTFEGAALCLLGYPDQAGHRANNAVDLAKELAHPDSSAEALLVGAYIHQFRRDTSGCGEWADAAVRLTQEHELPYWLALATPIRGYSVAARGQVEEGIAQMRQGLTVLNALDIEEEAPYFRALLAEVLGQVGQVEEAIALLKEALAFVDKTGERFWEAEVYRLKGELLLMRSASDKDTADAAYNEALKIARRQEAKLLELRAATSLARLWGENKERAEAHDLLVPVYSWFTEGFDTADLQAAKVLLDELS